MNLVTSKLIGISTCLILLFGSYTNVKALTGQTMTSTAAQPLAASAVYYVAPAGSDSNAGSVSSPFLTIQKCLNVVQVGNTCNISAGTYNESLTIKTSGSGRFSHYHSKLQRTSKRQFRLFGDGYIRDT